MLGLLKDSYNKKVSIKQSFGNHYMVAKCCPMTPKCIDFIEQLEVYSIIDHFSQIFKKMIEYLQSIGSSKMNTIGRQ